MKSRGEYFFLSNMYNSRIKLGSVTYENAEAAFQAIKLEDKSARKQFEGLNGVQAKRLGRTVKLRSDWNEIRIDAMEFVVRQKFIQNYWLIDKLLATGDEEIVEDNDWYDTFWGRCNGVGENNLGRILMKLRKEFSNKEEF